MKRNIALLTALTVLAALFFAGCASTPTALERKLFIIETNYVPVFQTNIVKQSVETNQVLWVTNFVNGLPTPSPVSTQTVVNTIFTTNVIVATNQPQYSYTPGPNATTITQTGGAIGNLFGVGGLITTALGGLFGVWASIRSKKANQTSEVLAQIIETGRQILNTTPGGTALNDKWKTWMIQHQAETGVIQQVSQIVANVVDTDTARQAAQAITAIITK